MAGGSDAGGEDAGGGDSGVLGVGIRMLMVTVVGRVTVVAVGW